MGQSLASRRHYCRIATKTPKREPNPTVTTIISMTNLDWTAVIRGAIAAGFIAGPTAVVMLVVGNQRELSGSSLVLLFFGIILMGFAYGGFIAGRPIESTPLMHAALAALLCYAVIQGLGIIRRGIAGEEIGWIGVFARALLASTFGMVGGFWAMIRQRAEAS